MSATTWSSELGSLKGARSMVARHGPRIAVLVLLSCLAAEAGVILMRDLGRDPEPAVVAPPAVAARRSIDLRAIVDAHLFGQAGVTGTDAPPTTIALVLTGVLALQDPNLGMAILGPSPAQARLYAVGAAVPGGALLHSVYQDRVLLDRGGVLEALMLPRKPALSDSPPAPAAITSGQRLQALTQNNGALLGGLVRGQAVFQQGKLAGYRIFPGTRSRSSAFAQLGFQSGDMITAVNGTMLDDPNRALDLLQTISDASSANITVLRDGAKQDIALNLATVVAEAERAAEAAPAANEDNGTSGTSASPGQESAGDHEQAEH